ncbi:MAG: hypothetical protein RIS92_2703 [Verrucomicrobiota bacterium]
MVNPRVWAGRFVGEIVAPAAKETEERAKSSSLRVARIVLSEMPFADMSRLISCFLEVSRNGWNIRVESGFSWGNPVLYAVSVMVASGHEGGARGAADGAGDVSVGESGSAICERVEVRRWNVGATLNTAIGVPHIVGDDVDDVRAGGSVRG